MSKYKKIPCSICGSALRTWPGKWLGIKWGRCTECRSVQKIIDNPRNLGRGATYDPGHMETGQVDPDGLVNNVPLAVVMIALNEAHNMEGVLQNLKGWAQEVFLIDSYSTDDTVDIALRHGVHVVQRRFRGFGDQWNFAMRELPITAPWTMKLDPDERLTDLLKASIMEKVTEGETTGIAFDRRLWFMGRPIPIRQEIVRVWKTGKCRFTEVAVNEHPIVDGEITRVTGELEHHDSPNLHHWYEKQNRYSTAEAEAIVSKAAPADRPLIFGSKLQRRMWMKAVFPYIPFRFSGVFLYHYLWEGTWRAGWVGYAWSRLRANVYLMRHFKARELRLTGRHQFERHAYGVGLPDARVPHVD